VIVIIDTNAYYGDVYAVGQELTALFRAVDDGDLVDTEIWTPRGVVDELLRQYGERAQRMAKAVGAIKHDLGSFGIQRPLPPSDDEAGIAAYRKRIEDRLAGAHRKIAAHPRDSGKIVSWAAEHRSPIKALQPPQPPKGEPDLRVFQKRETRPIFGVVDAAIWLTVIEAAMQDERVVLITNNRADFADLLDHSKACEGLRAELEAARVNPDRVKIYPTVLAFNEEHVAPTKEAKEHAVEFLSDITNSETLKIEIADAVSWFPVKLDEHWDLRVEIDYASLSSFEPSDLEFVRADPAKEGYFMTLWASGTGRFDLGIRKHEASDIPEDSPIAMYDWDWNESMVAAEVELEARLLVEARVRAGNIDVSIEDIEPV